MKSIIVPERSMTFQLLKTAEDSQVVYVAAEDTFNHVFNYGRFVLYEGEVHLTDFESFCSKTTVRNEVLLSEIKMMQEYAFGPTHGLAIECGTILDTALVKLKDNRDREKQKPSSKFTFVEPSRMRGIKLLVA